MGKKDTVTKEYMRNPVVFADAFNQYLYHGRQVIKPERLRELDTTEIAVPYGSGDAAVPGCAENGYDRREQGILYSGDRKPE